MTTTIRVQLAESPTDVLVWLVKTQPSGGSREEIAAAMTHLHPDLAADDALRGTYRALHLLHTLRFVQTRGNEAEGLTWYATSEGGEAVREAERAAEMWSTFAPATTTDDLLAEPSSPVLPAKSKEME